MKCRILHESRGRLRVRMIQHRMTMEQADKLQYYLQGLDPVSRAKVNDRTCDAIIEYSGNREDIIGALSAFDYTLSVSEVPVHTGRALQREYEDKLFFLIAKKLLSKTICPVSVRRCMIRARAVPFLFRGIRTLRRGRVEVPVLDAVTIAASLLQGDHDTAGAIIFLLQIGELLEEWTHKKSVDDLAQRMYLNVDRVWQKTEDGEVLVPVSSVRAGDRIIVNTGNVIPLDGIIESGEPNINQASMTGESLPVRKAPGNYVYAGTVVDEGSCVICVKQEMGSGRYDRIVRMIEDSEKLKSETESRAGHLADALVPYSLLGTALAYAVTRDVTRAMSVLMVDYSCALKLAMPISVLSAMRECSSHHITVKGGEVSGSGGGGGYPGL